MTIAVLSTQKLEALLAYDLMRSLKRLMIMYEINDTAEKNFVIKFRVYFPIL